MKKHAKLFLSILLFSIICQSVLWGTVYSLFLLFNFNPTVLVWFTTVWLLSQIFGFYLLFIQHYNLIRARLILEIDLKTLLRGLLHTPEIAIVAVMGPLIFLLLLVSPSEEELLEFEEERNRNIMIEKAVEEIMRDHKEKKQNHTT